jgi:hypothetical protein
LNKWSLSRVSEFGYARVHATRGDMLVQVSFCISFSFPSFNILSLFTCLK